MSATAFVTVDTFFGVSLSSCPNINSMMIASPLDNILYKVLMDVYMV